jgi:signal transduction histidine kinase
VRCSIRVHRCKSGALIGVSLSFRRKLLLAFSATIFVVVIAVAWTVSSLTRAAFHRINEERTFALIRQFQREFDHRGEEVVQQVENIARGEAAARMALDLHRAQPDYGSYVDQAKSLADGHRLDFLEFVDKQKRIISSAQWPAKFGYQDSSLDLNSVSRRAYLKKENLPQGTALGLFVVRPAVGGELFVAGGKRLDKEFLDTLDLPSGMRALLYQNTAPDTSAQQIVTGSENEVEAAKIAPLVKEVLGDGKEHTATIHWTANPDNDEVMHAVALPGPDGQVAGVLLIGASQRPYIELNRRVRDIALLVGGAGILLTVFLSSWAAMRVTRPVEQLAAAARSVAAGNLGTEVVVSSHDELRELADAFNHMTRELREQSDRLVQAERVAAWRELARRLAHELKNPLFPLQLTVENLVRAHDQNPAIFEEMFRESTATLLAEISNLKSIIGRFSEFSRMPQPNFQRLDVNALVRQVASVFQSQWQSSAKIECQLQLDKTLPQIAADADLLHRVISNLVLNAMDATASGGTITLATFKKENDRVGLEVRDTGIGLTPEECGRLFTPYYTTKRQGTGLGLAIVQSIVSDHHGTIGVRSVTGRGTVFTIELPINWDKLDSGQTESTNTGGKG